MEFKPEYPISQEPQRVDLLLLKRDSPHRIVSTIAGTFRTHNIIEYKGCGDDLHMFVIHKTIGYASMYYALQGNQASISVDDVTACIFRNAFPRNLFREFKEKGVPLRELHEGVYQISGQPGFMYPIQIVIIRELPQTAEYAPLRLLTKTPEPADIRALLEMAVANRGDKDYQRLAHTVANVAYKANSGLFWQIAKGDLFMTGTIIDLVEDQVQEREKKAADKVRKEMKDVIDEKDNEIQQLKDQLNAVKEQLNSLLEEFTKLKKVLS